jgi:hypothetical protein
MRLAALSYLGKRAISEGIGGLIRRFVALDLLAPRPWDLGANDCATRWRVQSSATRTRPARVRRRRSALGRLRYTSVWIEISEGGGQAPFV